VSPSRGWSRATWVADESTPGFYDILDASTASYTYIRPEAATDLQQTNCRGWKTITSLCNQQEIMSPIGLIFCGYSVVQERELCMMKT